MECKRHKNVDEGDSSPTLYCLLSSSVKVSKKTIGIILEQVRPFCQIFLSIGVLLLHSFFIHLWMWLIAIFSTFHS